MLQQEYNTGTFSEPFNLTDGQNIVIRVSSNSYRPLGKTVSLTDANLSQSTAAYDATPTSNLSTGLTYRLLKLIP